MRAYLRLDPHMADNKADYPDGAYRAFIECLCFAEQQHERGYFRNERLLRVLLDKRSKWIPFLVEHGDLSRQPDGRLYVEGWAEWQEGDHPVAERMRRIRQMRGLPAEKTPGARRTANYRLRTAIFERDFYTCRYCGAADYPREWLVMEHVDPNGPTDSTNLVTACRPCNKLKGGRTPDEAGMTIRDVSPPASRDASRLPVTPSSGGGGGKPKAESGGGSPSREPNFMGFRPKASADDVRRQDEEAWTECETCGVIGRRHPAGGDHPFTPKKLRAVK